MRGRVGTCIMCVMLCYTLQYSVRLMPHQNSPSKARLSRRRWSGERGGASRKRWINFADVDDLAMILSLELWIWYLGHLSTLGTDDGVVIQEEGPGTLHPNPHHDLKRFDWVLSLRIFFYNGQRGTIIEAVGCDTRHTDNRCLSETIGKGADCCRVRLFTSHFPLIRSAQSAMGQTIGKAPLVSPEVAHFSNRELHFSLVWPRIFRRSYS